MRRLAAALAAFALFAWAAPAAAVQIFITSGTTWVVPADWNSLANTIEVIGAGGSGGGPSYNGSNYGGGGGAYAKKINAVLTPGATISIGFDGQSCGASATQGTWVSSRSFVFAQSGRCGAQLVNTWAPGEGGRSTNSVGDVVYSGGNGQGPPPNSGAGGAAGPNGAGNSANPTNTTGGSGDAGFGGAAGVGAGAGGNGTEFDAIHGSGGGGGATGSAGLYGGGSGSASGSAGAGGLIIINYQPYRRAVGGAF